MALKDAFNNKNYEFHKVNDTTLRVRYAGEEHISYRFDFALRVMTSYYGQGLVVQPFDRIDRDVLIEMRYKLVEMGGKPPELPAEQPASPAGARRPLAP